MPALLRVAGLFAGIGGFELGLQTSGYQAEYLCEWWEPAEKVLAKHFPDIPLAGDIGAVESIPEVEVVCAGFPCTDLSQAGRTAGIHGDQSGLVFKALQLVDKTPPKDWLVLENVRNMLTLHRGRDVGVGDLIEGLGYRWAYRTVDSRSAGVPQRRQRVFLVASRCHDPRQVLFADDHGEPDTAQFRDDTHGFYWTEGLRGLGWAADATPTLKGGSTIGIPSPPGVWVREAEPGRRLVKPSITSAERLQGFPAGWTRSAVDGDAGTRGLGTRWKLVGNAVTVPVVRWLGSRLDNPGEWNAALEGDLPSGSWPLAAWGEDGSRKAVDVSMWPLRHRYRHLGDLLVTHGCDALTHRGALGFLGRLERSGLRLFPAEFKAACKEHVQVTAGI